MEAKIVIVAALAFVCLIGFRVIRSAMSLGTDKTDSTEAGFLSGLDGDGGDGD